MTTPVSRPLRLVALALAIGGSEISAQAPAELHTVVLRYTVQSVGGSPVVTDAVTVLDVDGTFGEVFRRSSVSATLLTPRQGPYTYARDTANTGTVNLSPSGGTAFSFNLTFVTATSGTLAGAAGAGTFQLTPIPLPGPLVNTSQRGLVNDTTPGIIGFVVPTGQTTLVLVRAIGPGLAAFDVQNHAIDPRIAVFREQDLIMENDDWDDDPAVKETIVALNGLTGAFPLSDGAKDAAIVLLLPPGNYTAQVRAAPGEAAAEVLGEVYAVP
jgi:hypothetical protein